MPRHLKKCGGSLTEIYGAIGCSKQNISYWHTHAHSTQFKKSVYEVVDRAACLFELSEGQSELLANSAGLSLQYEAVNLIEDLGYQGRIRTLCEQAMVSERMFRYYNEVLEHMGVPLLMTRQS